ncbi:aminotransferase class I/II-fold pyridoxal phosphate-dependent enzyme [uncultured Brachyspira sp.]|uniref:pyridoxal phosphate-dependent aminotransferase n=1 Tax=uncultured Brachyspira sp. TaxID=221953 RepID=UPI0026099D83|nr:aminotransferase class I/II-fold pyridoxal phosphate-dependent enzyme [uncultured Brachyspira sp.]
MLDLSERTKIFVDSVIRRMTRVCLEYDAVNLSQGFPDFDPPKVITDRLIEVANEGPHQYAVTWGSQKFRDALIEKQKHFMGLNNINSTDNVVVTCGSTEAMMAAMMAVCNPRDKVVVFSPYYENYAIDAILSGADPIFVPLKQPDFNFDANELEDAFKQNAKALILCNPSNPSGKVFTREELEIIASLAKKYNAYVITDEVYEHIVYKPHKHIYMSSLPDMFERTVCCSSLSKTYHITGWRLGYIIGPKHVIDAAKKIHDFLTVGAVAPLQEAAVEGLKLPYSYYDELQEKYTKMRDMFLDGLRNLDLKFTEPQGAYYVMVDISEFGYDSDMDFCYDLAKKVGVGAVPGSSFFKEPTNNLIRFHFSKKEDTVKKALDRLADIKSKMKK